MSSLQRQAKFTPMPMKYRVWDIETTQWICGDEVDGLDLTKLGRVLRSYVDEERQDMQILQHTGFFDHNGQPVFVGSIIKNWLKDKYYLVEFSTQYGWVHARDKDRYTTVLWQMISDCVIVGNIQQDLALWLKYCEEGIWPEYYNRE